MIDPKMFDDLAAKISKMIPDSVKDLQKDIEKNVKAVLQNTFAKMDLVTRDEFDAQTKVLARSREKLEALEKRLEKIEKSPKKDSPKKEKKQS